MSTMGRRLWWYWIALVASLTGAVKECHAIVVGMPIIDGSPLMYASKFQDEGTDEVTVNQVADFMNEALDERMLEHDRKVVVENDVPGLRGWQVLTTSLPLLLSVKTLYGRSWQENNIGISLILSRNTETRMDKAVNIANQLKHQIVESMRRDNRIWGMRAFLDGVELAVYVTRQYSIPMNTLHLGHSNIASYYMGSVDPAFQFPIIRIDVPHKELKSIFFDRVQPKEKCLPDLMDKLLRELTAFDNNHLLGEVLSIQKKLLFQYQGVPPTTNIDLMGPVQYIFNFVFQTMCHAAVHYVDKHDPIPFQLTFTRFRMIVNASDWYALKK